MPFALGYIAGVATCVFIAAALAYFRSPIVSTITAAEARIAMAGPRPKGFIFEPEPEAETVRQAHIAENAAQGKDTPIAELL